MLVNFMKIDLKVLGVGMVKNDVASHVMGL